jgi:hypothetical protein
MFLVTEKVLAIAAGCILSIVLIMVIYIWIFKKKKKTNVNDTLDSATDINTPLQDQDDTATYDVVTGKHDVVTGKHDVVTQKKAQSVPNEGFDINAVKPFKGLVRRQPRRNGIDLAGISNGKLESATKPNQKNTKQVQPRLEKPKPRDGGIDLASIEKYSFQYNDILKRDIQTISVYIYGEEKAYPLNQDEISLVEQWRKGDRISNMLEIYSDKKNVYLFSRNEKVYHILLVRVDIPNLVSTQPDVPQAMPVFFEYDNPSELHIIKYDKSYKLYKLYKSITILSNHVFTISPNEVTQGYITDKTSVTVICSIAYPPNDLNSNTTITRWYNTWSEKQCRYRFMKVSRWIDEPKITLFGKFSEWQRAYAEFMDTYKTNKIEFEPEEYQGICEALKKGYGSARNVFGITEFRPIYSKKVEQWLKYSGSGLLSDKYRKRLPKIDPDLVIYQVRYNTLGNDVFGNDDRKVKFLHSNYDYLKGGSIKELLKMNLALNQDPESGIDLFYDFRPCYETSDNETF